MERDRRLIIWLVAAAFIVPLLMKGHGAIHGDGAVPFFPLGTTEPGKVTVRISGNAVNPGVYHLPEEAVLETVTKMTVSGSPAPSWGKTAPQPQLTSGEVLELRLGRGETLEISRKDMTVEEKVLLGIPLDPNRMSRSDWEYLPGIGAETARRIVEVRQYNGGFRSPEDLLAVPGMGNGRVRQIRHFFSQNNNQ